jgi:hypothetical protein
MVLNTQLIINGFHRILNEDSDLNFQGRLPSQFWGKVGDWASLNKSPGSRLPDRLLNR